jgi:prephenate dehydratase
VAKKKPSIAFQGEHGAYSEEAIRQHYADSMTTVPYRGFTDIFDAVNDGTVEHGMLPVENSSAGTVAQSYELLLEHDLRVQSEIIFRVHHMLLSTTDTTIDNIQRVKSHPQALAQCEGYLRRRGWEPVAVYDTAGSARDLAANPEPSTAVLASALAGDLYGLNILERDVEDDPYNSTRFFVIGHKDAIRNETPQKTSVVFAVRHTPAALYECLGAFAQNEVNLTKLESRPMRFRPWQYWFYLDFEGHVEDPSCEQAIIGLMRHASMVKLLGSYPAAPNAYVNYNGYQAANGGHKEQ